MPRDDKTYKQRKDRLVKIGKTERNALKALGQLPKFPKALQHTKNHTSKH